MQTRIFSSIASLFLVLLKLGKLFQKAWYSIVSSKTIEQYEERLSEFTRTYSSEPLTRSCVEYIKETWLKPGRKESLVEAWVNKYTHFGITITSR